MFCLLDFEMSIFEIFNPNYSSLVVELPYGILEYSFPLSQPVCALKSLSDCSPVGDRQPGLLLQWTHHLDVLHIHTLKSWSMIIISWREKAPYIFSKQNTPE